ncbi:MAG: hypothetical protein NC094_12045 [Bacteroidales bacterium]|nr:hypothetical protein [Lachnoclostridium sp.]MCM1385273.1 hypothetical protein [Lachnoclostridium sp.]MCM1466141.1 hypothetical protein [Bacteroidales bacterium]
MEENETMAITAEEKEKTITITLEEYRKLLEKSIRVKIFEEFVVREEYVNRKDCINSLGIEVDDE